MIPLLADVSMYAWLIGIGVGLLGVVIGQAILRMLVRLRVPWWGSVAAPLLIVGPAIGILVGTWLHAGDLGAVALGGEDAWTAAKIGWSIVVFLAANTVFEIVRAFLASHVVQDELGLRIPSLLFDLARLILWVIVVFVIISRIWHAERTVAAALGVSAGLSLAVALAMQETFKNFIAGLAIVTEGMYKIGDWIWVGEDEGEVIAISRRTTKLRTRSSDVITIPNNLVTTGKVRNESRPTTVHAEFVYVSAAYDAPPNRVRDVLRRALLEVPKVLTNPAPLCRVVKFADSGIDYQVKFWITDIAGLSDIRSDVMIQIWYHFQRDRIEFPYPVREVRRRATLATPAEERARAVLARLRAVPFFQALPDDLIGVLARDADFVDYGAGERVVQQHDAADACYVVESGRLAVLISDGTHERQVAVLEAGELFGEMGLLTGEPRTATVRAIDDSRLVVVGSSSLSLGAREVARPREPSRGGRVAAQGGPARGPRRARRAGPGARGRGDEAVARGDQALLPPARPARGRIARRGAAPAAAREGLRGTDPRRRVHRLVGSPVGDPMQQNPFLAALKVVFTGLLALFVFLAFSQRNHLEEQVAGMTRENSGLRDRVGEMSRKLDDLKSKADRVEGAADELSKFLRSGGPRLAAPVVSEPAKAATPDRPSKGWGWELNPGLDARPDPSKPAGTPGRYRNVLELDPDPEYPAEASRFEGGRSRRPTATTRRAGIS